MTSEHDGPVPKPNFGMFVKELNAFEKQLGWFWFRGKKFYVGKGVTSAHIPYTDDSINEIVARYHK